MKKSPTAQALAELKAEGWLAEKIEQRLPIPGRFVTRDAFGILDILAMKVGEPILGLQVTSRSNVNSRLNKAVEKGTALTWVQCGGRFEVWGFSPTGKRTVIMTGSGTWDDMTERPKNASGKK